jgi:hypothetical protein
MVTRAALSRAINAALHITVVGSLVGVGVWGVRSWVNGDADPIGSAAYRVASRGYAVLSITVSPVSQPPPLAHVFPAVVRAVPIEQATEPSPPTYVAPRSADLFSDGSNRRDGIAALLDVRERGACRSCVSPHCRRLFCE